jgi:hypothetical protein
MLLLKIERRKDSPHVNKSLHFSRAWYTSVCRFNKRISAWAPIRRVTLPSFDDGMPPHVYHVKEVQLNVPVDGSLFSHMK